MITPNGDAIQAAIEAFHARKIADHKGISMYRVQHTPLDSERFIPFLAEAVEDENYHVRMLAVSALLMIGDPAMPAILEKLKTGSDDTRIFIARSFTGNSAGTTNNKIAGGLFDLADDSSARVRSAGIGALGIIYQATPEVITVASRAMQDTDSEVRNSAIHALSALFHRTDEAIPALRKALNAEDRYVRVCAARLLYQRFPEKEPPEGVFLEALQNGDDRAVSFLAMNLGTSHNPVGSATSAFVDELAGAFNRIEDTHTRIYTLNAFSALTPESKTALPFLKEKLHTERGRINPYIAEIVIRFEPESVEAWDHLFKSLKSDDYNERDSALEVITKIDRSHLLREDCISKLVPALIGHINKSEGNPVNYRVFQILGDLGPAAREAELALRRLAADNDGHNRKAAKEVLENICPDEEQDAAK